MTLYTKPDGTLTNSAADVVPQRIDPELQQPFMPRFADDGLGEDTAAKQRTTAEAKIAELTARREAERDAAAVQSQRDEIARVAAEALAELDDAARLQLHRARFDAATLEAADTAGVDPGDVLSHRTTDEFVEIVTRDRVYRNSGDGWKSLGAPDLQDSIGPYELTLTRVSLDELTPDEVAELDRCINPRERSKVFRSPEGLVVDFKGSRTLCPGSSGRPREVGLQWPDRVPPSQRDFYWAGPGTGTGPDAWARADRTPPAPFPPGAQQQDHDAAQAQLATFSPPRRRRWLSGGTP